MKALLSILIACLAAVCIAQPNITTKQIVADGDSFRVAEILTFEDGSRTTRESAKMDSTGVAGEIFKAAVAALRPVEDSLQFNALRLQYESWSGLSFFQVRDSLLLQALSGQWLITRTSDGNTWNSIITTDGTISVGQNSGTVQIVSGRSIRVVGILPSDIYLFATSPNSLVTLNGSHTMERQ